MKLDGAVAKCGVNNRLYDAVACKAIYIYWIYLSMHTYICVYVN